MYNLYGVQLVRGTVFPDLYSPLSPEELELCTLHLVALKGVPLCPTNMVRVCTRYVKT